MHGFDNARDFVEYTCNNYDEVYSSGMALLLVKKDNGFTCVVQLTPLKNDEFYDVKTVYVMPERTIKNKLAKDKIRLIWQKPNSPLSKSLSPYCLKSDNGIPTGFIKGTPDRSSISKPINKSINHAEKPSYQALQDIIDNSNAEVEKIKRQAYNFICKYLGLPKANKINKSITDELTVNGKIIFDPLYGKPLKQKDFVQMINRLENFLSRRLAESERRLLLQSTALGHLIALSKSGQTQLLLETTKLKNIKLNDKSFDSLCTDYNALKNNFEKVTETEIKKLQFIEDKIGVYVTSAKDTTIKIIKDIYYDAVINHKSKQQISQEMYDQLGFLNRSWDTIARTESNNLKNHAFIVGSLNDEGKTYFRRRVGSYNTCKICASHRDKIALWSEKPLTGDTINDELADIAIWSGKSNIGRNQKDWWIPEGSTHPNCFCEWEKLLDEEVKYFRKSFIESDHPRGNGGRFITKFTPDKGGVCGGSSEKKIKPKVTYLAEVDNEIIKKLKDFGINANGYRHRITSDFKKHVIKQHGNEKSEKARGQLAIKEKDFELIPTVIEKSDYRIFGVKRDGKDRIIYVKNMNNGSWIYFEEVLTGKRSLNGVTMFIKNGTTDINTLKKELESNKRNDLSKMKIENCQSGGSHLLV